MASTYTVLVGAPPAANKLAWQNWYYRLLQARLDACPLAQTTTYYFAENGNDTTGSGTAAAPYRTTAKAQTLLASGVRCRFKRGDVIEEAAWATTIPFTFASTISGATVDDWSDAATQFKPAPLFNNFRTKYNSAGWALAAGNRYTRAEATLTVGDIRRQDRRLDVVYTRVTSSALCESTSNSWYHDGATLHLNLAGTNPNTLNLEACPRGTVWGVYVNGADKIRLQNLRFDGFGLTWLEAAYGVHVGTVSGKEAVLVNVEVYRTGYHAIGHLGVSTTGDGIATFIGCKAGYCAAFGVPTVYISHSVGGGHETIFHDCEATYGALPDSTWYPASSRYGQSIYAHSSGTIGLVIAYDCLVANNAFGAAESCTFNNLPTATTLEAVRGFVVGERTPGFQTVGYYNVCLANMAKVNCYYELKPDSLSNQCLMNAQCSGWIINTTYLIDAANQTASDFALYNPAAPHSPQFWHCHLEAFNNNASWGSLIPWKDPATDAPNARMFNSIFQARGSFPAGCKPNFVNSSANIGGNAYFGMLTYTGTGGYDNDPGRVDLPVRAAPAAPTSVSALYRTGVALPGGYRVEYDQRWRPRLNLSLPSIGPLGEEYEVAAAPVAAPTITGGLVQPTTFLDVFDDVDIWDNTVFVTLTSTRTRGPVSDTVQGCLARQLTLQEKATSAGAYEGAGLTWLVPRKHVKFQGDLKAGDVIEPQEGLHVGRVFTAQTVDLAAEGAFYRLVSLDLSIVHDLRDEITIERPEISYDVSGVAVLAYPPNGGSSPYSALAAKVQLIDKETVEERLIQGYKGTHTVTISKQIVLESYDRVRWVKDRVTYYLDVKGMRNPERIDELPVLDVELKP